MGARGAKGKSADEHALAGNPGKRSHNRGEVRPDPLLDLKAPTFLNKYGKAEWRRIVPALAQLGLLGDIDRAALAGYCNAYGTWEEANRQLRKEGMVVLAGKNDYPIQNPLLAVVNKQSELMKSYLVEFGMTPAARKKVQGDDNEEDEDDPFVALAKRASDIRSVGGDVA